MRRFCCNAMNERMEKSFRYPVPKSGRTRLEQAEARTQQAETRIEHAKSRIEAAETRAEQAETRIESAKTRTEHAEARAEKAETRAEQAEARVEQVEELVETVSETLTEPPDKADLRALESLTGRQRQVLELIAMGENTKQIAGTLEISPKTVEYHRKKLMDGLCIYDVPGLVRFALRVGLIPTQG